MKVIFLDRDGVINKYPGDKNYVTSPDQFRFLTKAKEAILKLNKNGYKVFVISNQAGVSKGIFTKENLDKITQKMLKGLKRIGAKLDGVYYCIHQQEENCACRKPKTGLIDLAKKEHNLDLRNAFFIGDSIQDVLTAKSAKISSILVLSGKEKLDNQNNWEVQPDYIFKDLSEAVDFILNL